MGSVRFAKHCGKMYSRHLFSYGGLWSRESQHTFGLNLHATAAMYTRSVKSEFDITWQDSEYMYNPQRSDAITSEWGERSGQGNSPWQLLMMTNGYSKYGVGWKLNANPGIQVIPMTTVNFTTIRGRLLWFEVGMFPFLQRQKKGLPHWGKS